MNNAIRNCPFCGSKPEIKTAAKQYTVSNVSNAQNAIKIDEKFNKHGKKIGTVYLQTKFVIRCSNSSCIAHSITKQFVSKEECYARWNNNSIKENTDEN